MKKRNTGILSILVFLCISCKVLKSQESLFSITDACYQPWVISENEKGTDIVLEIRDVQHGVEFDSLIFRGMKLPVFKTIENNKVIIKTTLSFESSKLSIKGTYQGGPNQLLYHYKNEKHSYLIKKIRRNETVYLKKTTIK